MDLGGLPVADDMDGESLKPILRAPAKQVNEKQSSNGLPCVQKLYSTLHIV